MKKSITFRKIEDIEADKEALYDAWQEALTNLMQQEIAKVFAWFKQHYPKRKLKWVEGMGAAFWTIDDEIMQWNVIDEKWTNNMWDVSYVDAKPGRKARKLMPLWNFYQQFHDVTWTGNLLPCAGVETYEDCVERGLI